MTVKAPRLSGSKVLLEPFQVNDISDTYIGWLNDPVVVRYSNQRFVKHDRTSCLRYIESFTGTDNLFLGIRRLEDGRLIGTMTAYRLMAHGTVDIGILIGDTSVWGQGYGQDAWDTLSAWLLDQRSTRKMTAGTLSCNRNMVRLLERSGMHREAVRKAQEIVDGRPEDTLYYARFRGD